jgi:hypothetical protein
MKTTSSLRLFKKPGTRGSLILENFQIAGSGGSLILKTFQKTGTRGSLISKSFKKPKPEVVKKKIQIPTQHCNRPNWDVSTGTL